MESDTQHLPSAVHPREQELIHGVNSTPSFSKVRPREQELIHGVQILNTFLSKVRPREQEHTWSQVLNTFLQQSSSKRTGADTWSSDEVERKITKKADRSSRYQSSVQENRSCYMEFRYSTPSFSKVRPREQELLHGVQILNTFLQQSSSKRTGADTWSSDTKHLPSAKFVQENRSCYMEFRYSTPSFSKVHPREQELIHGVQILNTFLQSKRTGAVTWSSDTQHLPSVQENRSCYMEFRY